MSIIKDGRTSDTMEVGTDNHARVQAKTHTKEHVASLSSGDSYMLHSGATANTLTVTAIGGPLLYLANTNASQAIVITDIHLFTSSSTMVFRLIKKPTLGVIGNNNVVVPVNLNFGSSKAASATAYSWNEIGDGMTGLTAGDLLFPILPGGAFEDSVENMIILPQGSSISLEAIGVGEAAAAISFYFHPST